MITKCDIHPLKRGQQGALREALKAWHELLRARGVNDPMMGVRREQIIAYKCEKCLRGLHPWQGWREVK